MQRHGWVAVASRCYSEPARVTYLSATRTATTHRSYGSAACSSSRCGHFLQSGAGVTYPIRSLQSFQTATRPFSKDASPADELVELRALIEGLGSTNVRAEKEAILRGASAPTRELIRFIYDPNVRMHVRPANLLKYLEQSNAQSSASSLSLGPISGRRPALLDILKLLDSRTVSGSAALRELSAYAHRTGVLEQHGSTSGRLSLLDVFLRCLDRNLRVGVSAKTIETVYSDEAAPNSENAEPEPFGVALGHNLSPNELTELFAGQHADQHTWLVSRKLDGVRCILQVDVAMPRGGADEMEIVAVETLSRSGRPFTTLDVLKEDVHVHLPTYKLLKAFANRVASDSQTHHAKARPLRIFIDGEVCMLKPIEGTREAEYVEDFRGIVGPIKRKDYTIQNPAFFPFDFLTNGEFYHWKSQRGEATNEPFLTRLERVEGFVSHCIKRGSQVIRHLEQSEVHSLADLRAWIEHAAAHDWEGLILRDGQALYEGKRSKSIRKVKQWQEDEYTVQDVEISEMRLSVGQQYAQRRALASVVVSHKGTLVNVGSGFTAEQRIRFAAVPELILGKQITVAFFEESHAAKRPGEHEPSLRFPRVKAVWEHGGRDV